MTPLSANYWINEGRLALPEGFTDRSNQIFLPAHPDTSPHLSVARDTLNPEETMEAYVTRQIGILKQKLPGHRVLQRQPADLGRADGLVAGEQIDATYRNGQRTVYQRQAAFAVAHGPGVLILTGAGPKPFDDAFNKLWLQWLASFELRPVEASEEAPPSA